MPKPPLPNGTFSGDGKIVTVRDRSDYYDNFVKFIYGGDVILRQKVGNQYMCTDMFVTIALTIKFNQGNLGYLNIAALAELYHTSPRNIYRTLRTLIDADLIRRKAKGHYLLHPEIVWSGKPSARREAVQQWESGVI